MQSYTYEVPSLKLKNESLHFACNACIFFSCFILTSQMKKNKHSIFQNKDERSTLSLMFAFSIFTSKTNTKANTMSLHIFYLNISNFIWNVAYVLNQVSTTYSSKVWPRIHRSPYIFSNIFVKESGICKKILFSLLCLRRIVFPNFSIRKWSQIHRKLLRMFIYVSNYVKLNTYFKLSNFIFATFMHFTIWYLLGI